VAALTICSWNVNGLRATLRTGDFQRWLATTAPDIAGLYEVKATREQIDGAPWEALGYGCTWHAAEKPGYSGTVLLSKVQPEAIRIGLGPGFEEFDREGRLIEADYAGLTVIAAYFPNGGPKATRVDYKMRFFEAFLAHADALRAAGRGVVFMGDVNVAHRAIDVARPDEAIKGTGFLPQERAWIDRFLAAGYVDTLRALHPDARDAYSYWDAWRDRRARNVGWRIDYVFVSEDLLPRIEDAFIESTVMGSDHCPVGIRLRVD